MKPQPVEILECAEPDLQAVRDFYASWHFDGSNYVQQKIWKLIQIIESNPEIAAPKYLHFRRLMLHHSHYAAYYVIEQDVTTVVAVLDQRQNPRRIRKTLTQREPLRHHAARRRDTSD